MPVTESMQQPREKLFTPGEVFEGESPDPGGIPPVHDQGENGLDAGTQGVQEGAEPNWALPRPSKPCRPSGEGTARSEVPSQMIGEQKERLPEQGYPTSEQQLVEADKRRRKRLAALARDHIVKLREERQRMAYIWVEEYSMWAAIAKLCGISLGTLQAEYIYMYNRLLDCEKQPHSDFFVNLSLDIEDELDFDEERPFDLSGYDQYFEWDEAEYMKLQFMTA